MIAGSILISFPTPNHLFFLLFAQHAKDLLLISSTKMHARAELLNQE
jgi:hypothetical protein